MWIFIHFTYLYYFSLAVTFDENCNPIEAPIVCEDMKKPGNSGSDCKRLKHLCNDPKYYNVMTEQCSKTCGRCNIAACFDKINPKTRKAECSVKKHLCNREGYTVLMKQMCPRTCGYCRKEVVIGANNEIAPLRRSHFVCSDRIDNCVLRAVCGYCTNPQFTHQMYIYCAKTCNYCV